MRNYAEQKRYVENQLRRAAKERVKYVMNLSQDRFAGLEGDDLREEIAYEARDMFNHQIQFQDTGGGPGSDLDGKELLAFFTKEFATALARASGARFRLD
jgi:hypothetical protein